MLFERGVDHLNQPVNTIAPPVSDRVELSSAILLEGQAVGEWRARHRVGIEVVIKVDAVNIIPAGDFSNHGT